MANKTTIETDLNIKDPLIIMGNGPSLASINFQDLTGYDCLGIKASYKIYEKINWWPKYWTAGSNLWFFENPKRRDEVVSLVRNKDCGIQYFIFFGKSAICCSSKVIELNIRTPIIISQYDIEHEVALASEFIARRDHQNIEQIKHSIFKSYLRNNLSDNITMSGLINLYDNIKLNDIDFYEHPPLKNAHNNTFENFQYSGGSTSLACCWLGICMGYKKIILLGVDSNYTEDIKSSYFSNEIIDNNDEIYNKKNKNTNWKAYMENVNSSHIRDFTNFAKTINNIDIVNCSEHSKLDCFRKGLLKDELC